MGINPGNPAFGLPPAEDDAARQMKDLERTTRENLASVVRSFKSTVERLDAAIETLNEAVASIVIPQNAGGSTQNFAVTTSPVMVASCTLTVPEGYTRAVLNIVSFGEAFNDDTNGHYLYVQCTNSITGGSGEVYTFLSPSVASAVTTFQQVTLGGLTGGQTLVCGVLVRGTAAFSASTANLAQVSAQAIYLK